MIKHQRGFFFMNLLAVVATVTTWAIVAYSTTEAITDNGPFAADRAAVAAQAWADTRRIAVDQLQCQPDRDADGYAPCSLSSHTHGQLSLQCATGLTRATGCKLMDAQ